MTLWVNTATGRAQSGEYTGEHLIEPTSERPSPVHDPVIEGGQHVGWQINPERQQRAAQAQARAAARAYLGTRRQGAIQRAEFNLLLEALDILEPDE